MRRLLTASALLTILLMAGSALAQPKSMRGRRRPPPRVEKPTRDMRQVCNGRRSILAQEERRRDQYLADLAGVDSEISQLKRQLTELSSRRSDVKRLADTFTRRFADAERAYKKDCGKNENCDQYDTLADDLDRQGKGIEGRLATVRTEIDKNRREITDLSRRIDPLRREYQRLACNNMVPGETAQSTIDRCSSIFSEGNRLQSDLNRHNRRLPALKTRYEQLLAELRNIENRARGYETYMVSNCKSSKKVATVRNYGQGGVRKRAENLGKELDSLINEVTRLRGVRITVE